MIGPKKSWSKNDGKRVLTTFGKNFFWDEDILKIFDARWWKKSEKFSSQKKKSPKMNYFRFGIDWDQLFFKIEKKVEIFFWFFLKKNIFRWKKSQKKSVLKTVFF